MSKNFLVALLFLSISIRSISASAGEPGANPEREFIMSCTYGVLAGTLVGAASLAFIDRPGDNLQRVARGASMGLYVGIGLGFYTVYVLPKQLQKEEERLLEGETTESRTKSNRKNNWMIVPRIDDKGISGAAAFLELAKF